MSLDTTAKITITAPAASDGFGEVAVLNDPTDNNHVGYCIDATRSVTVRQALEERAEAHGVIANGQWYGNATRTLEVEVSLLAVTTPALTGFAAAHWHRDKLLAATNAMAASGTIAYTEQGGVARLERFVREQYPSGPNQNDRRMLIVLTEPDPRIYGPLMSPVTSPIPTTVNVGKASTFPTFTFTPSANGTVILRSTTLSQSVTLTVGTDYITTGTQCVVDFQERTVLQGGVYKQGAVVPGGTWWELIPNVSNSYTTNTGTASFSSAPVLSARSAWV